ncbi:MAG: isoleucine--tRNA ligase [Chlamydiota bacterium]|nr:isoleucine--tRNA ligase [Chlamydiota bacterium]
MNQTAKKKKYRVNLPKTSFPMKASLATREPEWLNKWADEGLEKRIFEKAQQSKKQFILHDGPPYANGHIHIGHALNKTLKDMIIKYKTHMGFKTRYVPGWDCHGLPIEHTLLKEMGKHKEQVSQLEFRKKARNYANKYVEIQKKEFRRLGIFGEWDTPYLTMAREYQASIARSFYELYEKGYIYKSEKPVYWSIGCETALAEAELEYQDKTSKAVFVTFPILDSEPARQTLQSIDCDASTPVSFMIWTTTPWTLPANVGIALNAKLDYGFYRINNTEVCIVATLLMERLSTKLGFEKIECLSTLKGSQLKEIISEYRHPFIDRIGRVILADYVSDEDGTGIVHIAPGHGEDDYVYGHIQNQLPILSPVDHRGNFTQDFGDGLALEGINVFDANEKIIEHLAKLGQLKGVENHQHSYPYCWRSKTPVIVRSTPQWFLKVDHNDLRKRVCDIIQNAEETAWYPDWGKNRILGMIESRPDWCLSRQRLWGVPIPVAYDTRSGDIHITEHLKSKVLEIFEKEGADAWFDKPKSYFLEENPETLEHLELEKDILDVWFDSGVSHQGVLERGHHLGFPCDLYLEGSDQHRGWFQTSLITAVALRGHAPFKGVLTHGFVVDGQGKKMSKSLGNVVSPQEVMGKFGADILRLWVSSCDTNSDIRMSPEILDRMSEAYRKIRNTFRYLLGNINDFNPLADKVKFDDMDSIDQWLLSRLKEVATEIIQCYESYKFHRIYQLVYDFCIMDLSSFYLDALKDRMYCEKAENALRKSSQSALFIVTKALCQLLAPILVFTSDEVWRSVPFTDEGSVHESLWDQALWNQSDANSLNRWNTIRRIRKYTDVIIEKMRESKQVGSSLECVVRLHTSSSALEQYLQSMRENLETGLIVSKVLIDETNDGDNSAFDLEWHHPDELHDIINIHVEKTDGHKCARCWKYYPSLNMQSGEGLCQRCFSVENELT